MTRLIILLFACILSLNSSGQSRKERKQLFESDTNYEIEMLGVGQDGTKVFKIYVFDKTIDRAIAKAKRLAVHACLFKGLPGSQQTHPTPAICQADDAGKQTAFFDDFFRTGGDYLLYINLTTDGMPSGQDRLKVKGGYKIGLQVQVLYDNLRKTMENKNMAKRLDSIF